ncbi:MULTISPECIES: endolytic transglycosylase MltG [unclassified Streptomyces]|uniref:endolytic transglycosylase MltG n=1 Tax=unclassified Streptomyces TaxID=2593676 RepID=UPI002DD79FD0|nr:MULTISPECIES: endolytic transglycosylase MltG [unclassified Streptomyces]WSA96312.1 endolytic transglycosylase MltG [Streptomyces sp. NBC_01795]WSB80726.1 endolytic transglycosylase MltG [Streptomyces sp. NBC_01775]WSS11065.1 endolytic transglycosylase MltG [Streptomyces sp. NBC_01186]WSS39773.1 endolytic transglycosylase MltG [Streptomyces sp. NBC_01187]
MTEYGRGPGSQPWHPDDPLYGDQEWSGGQAGYEDGWGPNSQQGEYSGNPGYPQYPGAQQPHDPYYQQQSQQYEQYEYPQQYEHPQQAPQYGQTQNYQQPQDYQHYQNYQHPQQQPEQQQYGGWEGTQGGGRHYDPGYGGQGGHDTGQYDTGQYGIPQADLYGTGEHPAMAPADLYGTGEHSVMRPADLYGTGEHPAMAPADPYGTGEYQAMGPTDLYASGEHPAYAGPAQGYQQQGGYAPPQPRHPHEHPGHDPQRGPAAPDPDTGWDPGPDRGEHAFFSDRDEEEPDDYDRYDRYDGDEDGRGRGRKSGTGSRTKRRSGCACTVVAAVLAAGVGTVGYFGYDFYQTHFGPAPDYPGKGSGEVTVKIPEGASVADMGQVLQREGVVKSPGAFVEAAGNKRGIQAGTYTLRKRMSGARAVELMLDPNSQNGLIVAEGWRAKKIYQEVDKKLDVPEGTTEKAAESGKIGLPKWAKGKPEGFLFPSRYSVGKNSKPENVLREMVRRAEAEYTRTGLEAESKKAGKTPEEVITIASLVQAEAQQDHEFGKVSRVIYNRLDKDMKLGFDSTINYAMGRSSLDTSISDTKYPSPYNTYLHQGLPPGPIGNPGHQAIEAALKPTKGDWLYFVTVKPGDTRFTDSESEHSKNVEDFNKEQRNKKGNGG